jgi:hypothetical protein
LKKLESIEKNEYVFNIGISRLYFWGVNAPLRSGDLASYTSLIKFHGWPSGLRRYFTAREVQVRILPEKKSFFSSIFFVVLFDIWPEWKSILNFFNTYHAFRPQNPRIPVFWRSNLTGNYFWMRTISMFVNKRF